jgi:hypothetical protein
MIGSLLLYADKTHETEHFQQAVQTCRPDSARQLSRLNRYHCYLMLRTIVIHKVESHLLNGLQL